ncbi:MAG: hypothetical protein ACYS72_01900 [Planctomycetota bacterium]|jgi:hypothetical protein
MKMDDVNFREKLFELLKDIDGVTAPEKSKVIQLTKKSRQGQDMLQQKLSNLQQSLDSLRLGLKYLIFDLEATRRENNDLRKRLDQNPPR